LTSIERTSDHRASISPALAWAQLCTAVICVAVALILGLTGASALAVAIAGVGAAVVGGIQITVHVSPSARSARPADAGRRRQRWWWRA
jgi:hypothetical protein